MKLPYILKEVLEYQYVVRQLVRQHLRLKYRRSIFGYLWTLLNPILMLMVLSLVFSSLLKWDFKSFLFIVFAGLVPWNIFSNTITQSCTTFISNEELVKKIYVPKILFPLSVAIALLIDGLIYFITVYPFIVFFGCNTGAAILLVPFAFLLLFIFTLGLGMIVSLMTVFFRDFQWLVPVAMQAWFFLTPILYDRNIIPTGPLSWLLAYNPLTPFIELFKKPLYWGVFPDLSLWVEAATLALIMFVVGLMVLNRYQQRIIYRL